MSPCAAGEECHAAGRDKLRKVGARVEVANRIAYRWPTCKPKGPRNDEVAEIVGLAEEAPEARH
jgi:hypothetical protein